MVFLPVTVINMVSYGIHTNVIHNLDRNWKKFISFYTDLKIQSQAFTVLALVLGFDYKKLHRSWTVRTRYYLFCLCSCLYAVWSYSHNGMFQWMTFIGAFHVLFRYELQNTNHALWCSSSINGSIKALWIHHNHLYYAHCSQIIWETAGRSEDCIGHHHNAKIKLC
jgi:hypothetical protein